MVRKLYKYTGTISGALCKTENVGLSSIVLDLYDRHNDDKAPIRIEALGGLADYIREIEGTDAEERYLAANWYYDDILYLHYIEIPSSDPAIPAKVIAQLDPFDKVVTVFGPGEYIETRDPAPMDKEEYHRWRRFANSKEHFYRQPQTCPVCNQPIG